VRQKAVVVLLLVLLCYILGLVTAFYFPRQLSAVLTTVLQGKIRPFVVSRNFNETIGYVTDRKPGPALNGNASYLGEYAGQASYGLITVQIPQHYPAGAPLDGDAIKKVESISYPAFLRFLQDRSAKPLIYLGPRLPALISCKHSVLRAGRARLRYRCERRYIRLGQQRICARLHARRAAGTAIDAAFGESAGDNQQ
jgi:hypothetical protein